MHSNGEYGKQRSACFPNAPYEALHISARYSLQQIHIAATGHHQHIADLRGTAPNPAGST